MPLRMGVWRTAHHNKKLGQVKVLHQNVDSLVVQVNYLLTDVQAAYTVTYLVDAQASVTVRTFMQLPDALPELPRFGMRLELPKEFDSLAYYGRGPFENYPDRNFAAHLGLYTTQVSEMYVPYIRPQENGHRTEVRHLQIFGTESGVTISAIHEPFGFNAAHNHVEDFDPGLTKKQMHAGHIVPKPLTALYIDYRQCGVGGDNSWGALPHAPYRLLQKQYSFSYKVSLHKL